MLRCVVAAVLLAGGCQALGGLNMFNPHAQAFQPSPQAYCLMARLLNGTVLMADAKCCEGRVIGVDEPCAAEPQHEELTYDGLHRGMMGYCEALMPRAVLLARTTRDVQVGLLFVRALKAKYVVRSGGHSQRCVSSCDDCLVLDLQQMKGFARTVSPTGSGKVYFEVEPGNTLQDVFYKYLEHPEFFPHGQEPTVAMGGHVTGGGAGQATRLYGVSADFIVGVEVVLASGRVMTVYDTDHEKEVTGKTRLLNRFRQDLLWAIRGNGHGQFGIITKFVFRTVPRPKFRVIGLIKYAVTSVEDVRAFWSTACAANTGGADENPRLTPWPLLIPDLNATGAPQLHFLLYYTPEASDDAALAMAEAMPVINAYLAKVPSTLQLVSSSINPVPEAHVYGPTMHITPGEVKTTSYECVSRYIVSREDVCSNEAYLTHFSETLFQEMQPQNWIPLGHALFAYFEPWGLGLTAQDPDSKKTSFSGRSVWGTMQYCRQPLAPGLPSSAMAPHLQNANTTLLGPVAGGWYLNYQDEYVTTREQLYPDQKVYAKLRQVKRRYDRANFFSYPLSVPPAQGWRWW